MTTARLFAEIPLATASELLDAFAPHRGYDLWQRPDTNWMFRGQAEAIWHLRPKAVRAGELLPFLAPMRTMPPLTVEQRRDAEYRLVLEFAGRVAERGYEVPGDSPELRDWERPSVAGSSAKFPPLKVRAMFGLAQHYRIPTRLLDWTFTPFVAAYFAAKEVSERLHQSIPAGDGSDGRLAVWALEHSFLAATCARWDPGAVPVSVPTWSNPNLLAQRGGFTLVQFQVLRQPEEDIPDLDALFLDPANVASAFEQGANPVLQYLYKFTLPHSEAPSLLYFLDRYGVNSSSVFPGHASVAESMREEGLRSITRPQAASCPSGKA